MLASCVGTWGHSGRLWGMGHKELIRFSLCGCVIRAAVGAPLWNGVVGGEGPAPRPEISSAALTILHQR